MPNAALRYADEFVRRMLVMEFKLDAVEIHNLYPQNEYAIRTYVYRKFREARWDQWARLINSDTE